MKQYTVIFTHIGIGSSQELVKFESVLAANKEEAVKRCRDFFCNATVWSLLDVFADD